MVRRKNVPHPECVVAMAYDWRAEKQWIAPKCCYYQLCELDKSAQTAEWKRVG